MSRRIACISAFLIASGSTALFAQKQPPSAPQGSNHVNPEWERIQEGLRQAHPMPEPRRPLGKAGTLTPPGGLMRFDPQLRSTFNLPNHENPAQGGVGRHEGKPATPPVPGQGGSAEQPKAPSKEGTSLEGRPSGASSSGTAPIATAATAPGPLLYPYSFPFNTVGRILGRWRVNGADYWWLCSASTTSDFHMVSAGHCVYNHDPTNNGSGVGAGWPAEMWAWVAQTDVVDPADPNNWPDYPYGVAKATLYTTYNAWINSSDLNWDFSFITLDRRLGDHTGWMGREWNTNTSSLNFDGYPAEAPYVPSNNPYQYPGYNDNNVLGYTCCRIQMSAYTYGGHSGGPVWRFDGTNRYLEGVNSTSNRTGYAEATLLTSQIETDLENTIAADVGARPPANLAQVIEYVFNGSSKGLGQTSTSIGSSFPLTLNAFNAGYADAGTTTADIYLTTDPNNVTSGTYIGNYNFGYLGTYTYSVQTTSITIPTYVSPGYYYVGYVLNAANPQYGTDKNSVVIENATMHAYCNADGYEPDNSAGSARVLSSGGSQYHTICDRTDQDWAKFTLSYPSAISLTTTGYTGGDTTMTLYNSSLNQVDYNDDNGVNLYSTISRTCAATPLPAGTYYVKIASYAQARIIPNYTLSLNATPCPIATSTTIVSSLNPSVYGQAVTFTATVTSAKGTPGGTVSFRDGAATLATIALSSGHAAFTTSALAGGSHSITAAYNGASPYTASTSAVLTQTVNKAGSSTTITTSANPSTYGAAVTFTATVHSATTGTPTGTVTFKDGANTLATKTLSGGVATLAITTLAAGSHSITAVYAGSVSFNTSASGAIVQTVNKAASTTTLTSSKNPALYGQLVTFTATVKSSTTGVPTGTVTFKDGATVLGTVSLVGGIAKLNSSTLNVGSRSITAVYAGDANFTGSTSAILTETVNPAPTSTSIVSSLNPSTHGSVVTFTATVTPTTSGTPTGTVTFKNGTVILGSVVLSGGKASYATSALTTGAHSMTAVYAGSARYTTSTSPALTQTVNP